MSLAYNFRGKYHLDWSAISHNGSKCLAMWESENLVHWSAQRLAPLGNENFGCLWAPDAFYDPEREDYVLHWSSTHASNGFGNMGIWYTRTKVANLRKLGIPADKAYQWGNSRLGYWRIAGSPVLKCSITNERLAVAGYFSILNYYESLHLCG